MADAKVDITDMMQTGDRSLAELDTHDWSDAMMTAWELIDKAIEEINLAERLDV